MLVFGGGAQQLIMAYLANGQPLKLLGITYLVGKIKFKFLFQGPLAK